jgi:hypothetical protein
MFRLLASAVSLALIAFASLAHGQAEPARVGAVFNKIYAPGGYDSNDHIQFVGEGIFRNTCYRPAQESVQVDSGTRTITVGPVAYEYSGFCLQVILPFQRVVDVGILKVGNWKVIETNGTSKALLGTISIQPALTNNPDDALYAPINQAFFQQKGSISEITLTGEFPNSCMALEDVKVTVEKEAVVIQPFAKMDVASACRDGKFEFTKTVSVTGVREGRYLLHVRSMNGNAVNTLIDIK